MTSWMIEGGSPNALLRRGFNKNSLPVGAEIVVEGYQAKDASNRANGRDLTFTDVPSCFSVLQTAARRTTKTKTEIARNQWWAAGIYNRVAMKTTISFTLAYWSAVFTSRYSPIMLSPPNST